MRMQQKSLLVLKYPNTECDERDGAFADQHEAVDISEEGTEADRQSCDTSKNDESNWCDSDLYFESTNRARDQNPGICPNLT
jgi:asparagine synthetase A